MSAFDKVKAARDAKKPTTVDFIENMFGDSFFELHGDRRFGDDKAVIGGLASLNGMPVTVIGLEKGRNTKERMERNFGSAHPEGYRKALRLMKQAEKFHRPVLCFVDTSGAFCGIGAEERGQGQVIAKCIETMSSLKIPTISYVIGEGSSGGALAIGVADRVCMLENAIYSILSPEGYASILWKDSSRKEEAAEKMKLTANDLLDFNVIDSILKEPNGNAKSNIIRMSDIIKEDIILNMDKLIKINKEELLDRRYNKYRKMGGDY